MIRNASPNWTHLVISILIIRGIAPVAIQVVAIGHRVCPRVAL